MEEISAELTEAARTRIGAMLVARCGPREIAQAVLELARDHYCRYDDVPLTIESRYGSADVECAAKSARDCAGHPVPWPCEAVLSFGDLGSLRRSLEEHMQHHRHASV